MDEKRKGKGEFVSFRFPFPRIFLIFAIVFSNPGTMLVSKEQYYTGGESVYRNRYLQKMFSMIGVADKAGSGTDKIVKGWRDANWRSPKLDVLGANGMAHNSLMEAQGPKLINNSVSSSANSASNSASSSANSASNSASLRRKRLSKDELRTLVLSICTDWVSIEDIVAKSGKSLSYIRNSVMPLLLAEKSIVMMYLGTPHNPNQKYKVKE